MERGGSRVGSLTRGLSSTFGAGDVGRQRQACNEKQSCQEIGSAGKMERGARRDRQCEDLREKNRAGHAGDGAERVDGSLQLALRGGIDAAGHQRLHGGAREAPQRNERNDGEGRPAAAGKTETRKATGAEKKTGEESAARARRENED